MPRKLNPIRQVQCPHCKNWIDWSKPLPSGLTPVDDPNPTDTCPHCGEQFDLVGAIWSFGTPSVASELHPLDYKSLAEWLLKDRGDIRELKGVGVPTELLDVGVAFTEHLSRLKTLIRSQLDLIEYGTKLQA